MLKILNYYKYLFAVSGIILIAGLVSLIAFGLKPGIDFTAGSLDELHFTAPYDINAVRQIMNDEHIGDFQLQTTDNNGLIIHTKRIETSQHDDILAKLKDKVGPFEETQYEFIDPIAGKELTTNAAKQLLLVSAGIVLYIAYAFRKVIRPITPWRFGWAAIIALLHDLLVVLGIFSLLGHFRGVEVDSMFVTAMLTVLGFSVHDTIVVFDRIRENLKIYAGQSIEFIINHSISQTLVRSLNTSLTVLFVLLAMLLFGGETIRYFVLALFIGIVTGTYSSIFVASPILVVWQRWKTRKA
jgi:preprotein translocase subunit SecF